MNASLLPEILLGCDSIEHPQLPLATDGVQRYVWESDFGPMLIEVRDGAAFVNGDRVRSIAELQDSESTQATSPD